MRLKTLLITVLLILVFATASFGAAGYCTQALTKKVSGDSIVRVLTFSCTANTGDATIPDTTVDSNNLQLLKGWKLCLVNLVGNHAGTEPKEDCDVYLYQAAGGVTKAIDLLGGNGVDELDNTVNKTIPPLVDSVAACQPILGSTVTLDVDGNDVNSATFTVEAIFMP